MILIIISAFTSVFSLHLLSLCGVKSGLPASFYSVTDASVPKLTFLVDLSCITLCIGTAISYLIVIGGLMPQVMDFYGCKYGLLVNRQFWILIGFCIVMPLSCPRKLEALRFTSAMCVCFVIILTIIVLLYSLHISALDPCANIDVTKNANHECVGVQKLFVFDLETMQAFSIFIFAFCCQPNIFMVTNELRKPSFRRYRTVMSGAVGLTTLLYITVAICGYSTYGRNVQSNVLESYSFNQLTSLTRIMVCILVAFTFPLNCQPARTSTLTLW